MKIDVLIQQHLKWKSQTESLFFDSNCQSINPTTIGRDDCCDLGKWIYSSKSDSLSSNKTFQQLKKAHKEFHIYAGKILMECKTGDANCACSWLAMFHNSAEDVIGLLRKLKEEVE